MHNEALRITRACMRHAAKRVVCCGGCGWRQASCSARSQKVLGCAKHAPGLAPVGAPARRGKQATLASDKVQPPPHLGVGTASNVAYLVDGTPLFVGDMVQAHWRGGLQLYPGTMTHVRDDGSLDIHYDDGDTEEGVAVANVKSTSERTRRRCAKDNAKNEVAVPHASNSSCQLHDTARREWVREHASGVSKDAASKHGAAALSGGLQATPATGARSDEPPHKRRKVASPGQPRACRSDGHLLPPATPRGDSGHTHARKFLPFEQALAFVRSFQLANRDSWRLWCQKGARPPTVPANPDKTYKHGGWLGWGHWLGGTNPANAVPRQTSPFEQAHALASSLKLNSATEWRVWCKSGARPPNVPAAPNRAYVHAGWQDWGQWLGTGNQADRAKSFLSFDDALAIARSLRLTTKREWQVWCKSGARPNDVPHDPDDTYMHEGWQGWGHWLGTGNQRKKDFPPFPEALVMARSLELNSHREWLTWCKRGDRTSTDLPSAPNQIYQHDGWEGYSHWLGTGDRVAPTATHLPFDEALTIARALRLLSHGHWRIRCQKGAWPRGVPTNPDQVYKLDGWRGWGHWLGTGTAPSNHRRFLPFGTALAFARSLKMNSRQDWDAWRRTAARPGNIPSNPDQTYKHNGWQGYGHWLGSSNLHTKQTLSFAEALAAARSLRLNGQREWELWCKAGARPSNVPACPSKTYKHDGWQGWGHWLGTGNISSNMRQYLPFPKALGLAQTLGLHASRQWHTWWKDNGRQANVPQAPDNVYARVGWQGWGHWPALATSQHGIAFSCRLGLR